jgi:excinuclease UvrABC nuclease subunit
MGYIPFSRASGVYILYWGESVQYVGQTENLKKRLSRHLTGVYDWKHFDEVNMIVIEDWKERLLKERELIVKYQPALNDKRHFKPRTVRPEWMPLKEWKEYRKRQAPMMAVSGGWH